MELKNNYKKISIALIFLSFSSFFLGFYLDENSAGGGSYVGDWVFAWPNLQIFLNNDILTAINHEDLLTNRTPLLYILHKLFNPFAGDKIGYRISVLIISLAIPVMFYFCLKQKFKNESNLLLILLSSIIFLSPYYRTSSYWGLEENYGIISLLLTFLFLHFFLNNKNQDSIKSYSYLFFSTFFSSICIYFDQKLLIIPLICFFTIITCKKKIILKIFSIFLYFIFSMPYIYLIKLWGGIFPTHLTQARNLGDQLYIDHLGYTSTIIAFYLLPLLLLKEKKLTRLFTDFFLNKNNRYLILLSFIYIFSLIILSYFYQNNSLNNDIFLGKGIVHKLSFFLFENVFFKKIFIYFSFLISWIILLIFVNKNLKNSIILLYFFIFSLVTYPLLQEYFDPLIFILVLTFFSSNFFINYKNVITLFLYFLFFLVGSNIYYLNLFNI
jgi:hypothetical protein